MKQRWRFALGSKIPNQNKVSWDKSKGQSSSDHGELDRKRDDVVAHYLSIGYDITSQSPTTTVLTNGRQDIYVGVYEDRSIENSIHDRYRGTRS